MSSRHFGIHLGALINFLSARVLHEVSDLVRLKVLFNSLTESDVPFELRVS